MYCLCFAYRLITSRVEVNILRSINPHFAKIKVRYIVYNIIYVHAIIKCCLPTMRKPQKGAPIRTIQRLYNQVYVYMYSSFQVLVRTIRYIPHNVVSFEHIHSIIYCVCTSELSDNVLGCLLAPC